MLKNTINWQLRIKDCDPPSQDEIADEKVLLKRHVRLAVALAVVFAVSLGIAVVLATGQGVVGVLAGVAGLALVSFVGRTERGRLTKGVLSSLGAADMDAIKQLSSLIEATIPKKPKNTIIKISA